MRPNFSGGASRNHFGYNRVDMCPERRPGQKYDVPRRLRKRQQRREKARRQMEELKGSLEAGEAAQKEARRDPLEEKEKLLDKLAELESGSVPGTQRFDAVRRVLAEKFSVENLLKPGERPTKELTPEERERFANRAMAKEIAKREAEAPEQGEEAVEETAAESELATEPPPMLEMLSQQFDREAFEKALVLPDRELLPIGPEREKLGDELSDVLEAHILSVLGKRVLGGSLPDTSFPAKVKSMEDKLGWAAERAAEQARYTRTLPGVWENSLALLGALEESGLDHKWALRTVVYAATNLSKVRTPAIFGITLNKEGLIGDPMDNIHLAIKNVRSGDKERTEGVASKLEALFTDKGQELRDVELNWPVSIGTKFSISRDGEVTRTSS